MSTTTSQIPGSGNFVHGIHPGDRKGFSADAIIEVAPTPAQVVIPLSQHIGAPCEAVVKVRDAVTLGQEVGKATGFVSAPVHASINGVVGPLTVATLPTGKHVSAVPIKADGDQLAGKALYEDMFSGDWSVGNLSQRDPHAIISAIQAGGLVGMGGATFPTHVKLTRNDEKPVDTLLINGCECEPYLTADYRLMLEAPKPIIAGAILAAHAAGATRIIVAIEDNKPLAIQAMTAAAKGTNVEIASVHTKYPMGGERQTIPAVLDRKVPTGGLPLDVGVVVCNVGTAAAIARAVLRGKPLTHRVISVTGAGIKTPKNILAPVGMTYQELVDLAGGFTDDAARVISGGPMMGFAVGDLNAPVTKGTSGVVVMTADDVEKTNETACVRCGRCVDVCPLKLVPTKIALAAKAKDWDLARKYSILACCECGCCAYICPAGIPLAQLIRTGKVQLPRE